LASYRCYLTPVQTILQGFCFGQCGDARDTRGPNGPFQLHFLTPYGSSWAFVSGYPSMNLLIREVPTGALKGFWVTTLPFYASRSATL
jgi:hypothetical protein